MWMRMRFDIGWHDVARGMGSTLTRLDRERLERRVCRCWPRAEQMFPCLSVRTGFDLLWTSLKLPPGSEVLMSSLTIPSMVSIVKHHQLVPVPVDLNLADMAPDLNSLRRAITPRSRAIVVAHLFGSRLPLEPIVKIARQLRLLLIEDCAQAFVGFHYDGHPDADVTMFSFGPIKTSTAFGGAVLYVRDPDLLAEMQLRHRLYPLQSRGSYLTRFLKYSFLKGLSCRPLCDLIVGACRGAGVDYDHWINGAVRAFPGPQCIERLRFQPSAPLLATLGQRLETFDPAWIAARAARAGRLARLMPRGAIRPSSDVPDHSYWVFPVLTRAPASVIAELAKAGFDATQGTSLCVIDPPEDRPELDPKTTREVLAGMVFLPLGAEIPQREIQRLAKVLNRLVDHLAIDPNVAEPPTRFTRGGN